MRATAKIQIQKTTLVVAFAMGLAILPERLAAQINPAFLPSSLANDAWYIAIDRCGDNADGLLSSRVNQENSKPVCLTPVIASRSADEATISVVPEIGSVGGTEIIRIEGGSANSAKVRQVFTVITTPANPLDLPVDRLSFYQATASSCSQKSRFSFTPLNNRGLLGSRVLRGWGERDVRVNPAYDLPEGWTIEDLRHEVLFEQAAFRGIVERPTFDILHPFAERPLLVTVFDLLPAVRTSDKCPTEDRTGNVTPQ